MRLKPYESFFVDNGFCNLKMPIFEAIVIPKNILNILKDIFYSNKKNIMQTSVLNQSLIQYLNNIYKNHKIQFIKINETSEGSTVLKSFYDIKTNIITLYLTKDSNEYLLQDFDKYWDSFKLMLGHECIHRMQYLRQKVNKNYFPSMEKEIKYYSNKQEIMAFAWQAIFLYLCYGKTKEEMKKAVTNKEDRNNYFNYVVNKYNELFSFDSNIMKIFKKYCYEYINKMDV